MQNLIDKQIPREEGFLNLFPAVLALAPHLQFGEKDVKLLI
jgi:hypothetical protein